MVAFFTAGTLAIALPGFKSPMPVLYLLIFIAGATTIGTQILLCANTAQFYPLAMRSTGLDWASGVGRTGAIVGPLLGGSLLTAALPLQMNFLVFSTPGLVAALAMGCFILFNLRSATPLVAPATNSASRRAPTCRLGLRAKYSAPMHEIPSAPGAGDCLRSPPPKKLEKP